MCRYRQEVARERKGFDFCQLENICRYTRPDVFRRSLSHEGRFAFEVLCYFQATALHGDRCQEDRDRAIREFKVGCPPENLNL